MKKFLCGILVCAMPLAMLAGCGSVEMLAKSPTSLNAANFTYSITESLAEYKANVDKKIADNAGLPAEETAFDFSALSSDDGAEEIFHNTTWNMIEKANAENMFALAAYHLFEIGKQYNHYDMSFLSTTQSDYLKSFLIQKSGVDGAKTIYFGKLTGFEDAALNLPVPVPSKTTFVDAADAVINQLGNNVKFEAYRTESSIRIGVQPAFSMPTETDVKRAIGTQDISYEYDAENQTITLVYLANDTTYSKKILFETNGDGVVEKSVMRFAGDVIDNPDLSLADEYSYALELAENAKYDIFGDYEISFSAAEGGIYCRHNPLNENLATISEYYLTKTGEIVARIKQTTTMGLMNATTIDLLIESSLSQGKMKYAFQKIGETVGTLRNEPVLTKNFCDITDAQRALAEQTTSLNVEIVAFEITDTKLSVDRAVQKG